MRLDLDLQIGAAKKSGADPQVGRPKWERSRRRIISLAGEVHPLIMVFDITNGVKNNLPGLFAAGARSHGRPSLVDAEVQRPRWSVIQARRQ